jgi:hypothetical protein
VKSRLRKPCTTRAFACVLAATTLGCIDARVDFQHAPTATQVAQIRPGETTRSEVLRWLGPPDEVRLSAAGERLRRLDARKARAEAGDIFGDSAWTWALERRTERIIGLLPVGVVLFRVRTSTSRQEQWRVEFTPSGTVRSVSHVDEISEQ